MQTSVNDAVFFRKSVFQPAFLFALTIIFIVSFSEIGFAQSQDARITGQIQDATGAVVPNATVVITNVGTNDSRTVTSGGDGNYFVSNLRPAVYTVAVTATGFAQNTITDVQVSVAQQLDLPIVLQPQGSTNTVTVTSASEAAIDTSSARIGATVNQREVQDLPLNGRQLSQLYLQAPGTVNTGTGTFGDIRFSGRSNEQNAVRYDGVEGSAIVDSAPGNLNGEVASPFRLQSSLENVQEFRADSNNYPAELGTGTGGQVSVVTKSGTNNFHGSIFEYFRNDRLDARNFFDNVTAGIPKSKLRLNQFGGSVGGPIIKNKLFFFGSYEGYRVRAGVNNVELVPSLGSATNLDLSAPNSVIPGTATPVNNVIKPYLAGFRGPGVIISPGIAGSGLDVAQLQGTETTNEDAFFGRIDYHYNDKNTFYVRYFRDKGTDFNPEGVSGRITRLRAIPDNGAASWQSIITPNLVNSFSFGVNRASTGIDATAPTVNGIDFSNIIINVGGNVAQATSNTIAGQGANIGISTPGGLVRANSSTNGRGQPYSPYSLSFIDSLNYTRATHNIKFGGEIRRLSLRTDRLGGTTYTFSNYNSFLSGTLQQIQYVGDLSATSPFTGNSGQRTGRETFYIVYGQDEWRIRPNLTLSYGLRYEYYTPLREKNDAQIYFDINNGTLRDPKTDPYKTSKNNFGPRIALTYSPFQNKSGFFGGDKTVLRGGFGIYYGPGQLEDQIQPIESNRISSTVTGGLFSGNPVGDAATIAGNFVSNPNNRQYQPRAYSSDYTIPERVYQYSVSYQQELPYNLVSTIGYVGSKGRNLFLRSVANQILPGNATVSSAATAFPTGVGIINRVNAAGQVTGVTQVRQFDIVNNSAACSVAANNPVCKPFAEIDYKTSGGRDSYNALQTSLARRFNSGLTLNAQYTFASSRGNTSGSNDARTSAQLDNFEADFGRNNFDVRHSFNLSALYALPIGKGKAFDLGSGAANYILGGWEVGGIVNARSGLPIEVLIVRNDVVAQCVNASGCIVNTSATATALVPNGFVTNLPTVNNGALNSNGTYNAPPLPAGFVAVINTPGGGASRNVRRPNIVSGQPFYLNNDRNILNPAAFATPAPGTFGNLPRNSLVGPNFKQFDLTLSKRFAITERANIQFRTEVFNIFNITNFANPSATLNNSLPSFAAVNPTATNGLTTPIFTVNPAATSVSQPGVSFDQSRAGGSFGQIRSTVGRTVGLGNSRQIQFALRLNF